MLMRRTRKTKNKKNNFFLPINQCHNHTFPISSLRYKDYHPTIGKTASVFKRVCVCLCVCRSEGQLSVKLSPDSLGSVS